MVLSGLLIYKCFVASMRKPSMPRSNQKSTTEKIYSRTLGLWKSKKGEFPHISSVRKRFPCGRFELFLIIVEIHPLSLRNHGRGNEPVFIRTVRIIQDVLEKGMLNGNNGCDEVQNNMQPPFVGFFYQSFEINPFISPLPSPSESRKVFTKT